MPRSFEPITEQDLNELLKLALEEHEAFFKRKPEYESFYKNNLLAIVLGQGAALHYLNGKYGVNDFDVYLFYRDNPEKKMSIRRPKHIKSHLDKFDNPKVDFIRKAINTKYIVSNEDNPQKIIEKLLNESKKPFVKYLTIWAKKEKNRTRNVVIGLYPKPIFKMVLWDGEVQKIF